MKANMKFSNPSIPVLNQWHPKKKRRLFIFVVHLKNATREPKFGKEQRRMRFHFNILKKYTINIKIGSKLTILKKFSSLTQLKISKTMKWRLPTWSCNSEISSTIDFLNFLLLFPIYCHFKIKLNLLPKSWPENTLIYVSFCFLNGCLNRRSKIFVILFINTCHWDSSTF